MKIIIGTRGSALALAQAKIVEDKLTSLDNSIKVHKKIIKTKGDIFLNKNLDSVVDKGFFVHEIQQELIDGNIDIAVHSLKDLPTITNKKLKIIAYLKRDSAKDCVVFNNKVSKLNEILTIGTSSIRRKYQIKNILPNAIVKNIRGNVDTRINKLKDNKFDALVLALAGINRLRISDCKFQVLDVNDMLPAVGQGTIAVEAKSTNSKNIFIEKALNDVETEICSNVEREFLRLLNAGCNAPVAAYCRINNNSINLRALIFSKTKKIHFSHEISLDISVYKYLAKKMFEHFKNSNQIDILND